MRIGTGVKGVFEQLKEKGDYGEIILVAWAYTEYMIDQFVFEAFSDKEDPQIREFVKGLDFNYKWEFLKKHSLFSKDEKAKITIFQNQRNKLFHTDLFNNPKYYAKEGRKEMIQLAIDSFEVVSNVFERKYNSQFVNTSSKA